MQLKREWLTLEEIVGGVLRRLPDALAGREGPRRSAARSAADSRRRSTARTIAVQSGRENALKHITGQSDAGLSPKLRRAGSAPCRARSTAWACRPAKESRVFDKFHRGQVEAAQSGNWPRPGHLQGHRRGTRRTHPRRTTCPEGGAEFLFSLLRDGEPLSMNTPPLRACWRSRTIRRSSASLPLHSKLARVTHAGKCRQRQRRPAICSDAASAPMS